MSEELRPAIKRHQVVPLLAQRFVHDYEDAIKYFELPLKLEVTEHLISVVALIQEYAQDEDPAVYGKFVAMEEALIAKYRKTIHPYWVKQFHQYFDFGGVLYEKNIYASEAYNGLTEEEKRLTAEEIVDFIFRCRNLLHHARTFIYLQMEPEAATGTTNPTEPSEPEKEYTKARQLLALYYLLKAGFGIEHRNSHPVSELARLAHLLTGTKFTSLQHSDIYKKYAQMPNYKSGEHLLGDLRFIRPFFEQLQLTKVTELIDEKIQEVQK